MMEDKALPGYQGHLNDRCVTMAEVLRPAGYFTIMSGKWHVGQERGVTPWTRGFDRSLNAAAGGFYYPDSPKAEIFLNGTNVGSRGGPLPNQWYSTDLWTDFGIKFIDEALAAKKPFYLHLCHNAPHFPLQAPQDESAVLHSEISRFRLGQQPKLRKINFDFSISFVDYQPPAITRKRRAPASSQIACSYSGYYTVYYPD